MATDELPPGELEAFPEEVADEPENERAPALLVVLTGADHWTLNDGTEHPSGFWAEELVVPLRIFRDAGLEVRIATLGGVAPTVDEASLTAQAAGGEESADELRAELGALSEELASPLALEDVSPEDYDGVFVPGGHGPMEDLADSRVLGDLLVRLIDADRVVAAVCHGPAALLSARREDGSWALAGREIAGFTNDEESQAGFADRASWLLEDRLRDAGGNVSSGPAWQSFAVVDGNLVTGQNPASSAEVADRTVERLRARKHFVHVVPHGGSWTFKHEHGEPLGIFSTRKEAQRAALDHARAHGDWEIVIHDRRGRFLHSTAVRPG